MEDLEKGEFRKALSRYTQVFSEMAVVDGLVMRGGQLVIPKELQSVVVQLAHEGHFMYEKTLNTLRQSNLFPGMAEMGRAYVESCKACQASDPSKGQEPLKLTPLPDRPWQYIHADFKGPIGKQYYLHTCIDQYTKYPVVEVFKSTSWEQMEPMMEKALGLYWNVEQVTKDVGPPCD